MKKIVFVLLCFITTLTAQQESKEPKVHDNCAVFAIPKTGSHLLMRCLELLLDKEMIVHICPPKPHNKADAQRFCDQMLRITEEGKINKFYAGYERGLDKCLNKIGFKKLITIRDPRDALVSLVLYMNFAAEKPDNPYQRDFFTIGPEWESWTFDERLSNVMTGYICDNYMEKFYIPLLPWFDAKNALVVPFEDLIGPLGQGSAILQEQMVWNIVAFLHADVTEEDVSYVCDNLYLHPHAPQEANGIVYIPAQAGNWKLFFSEEHKALFKQLYGDILIRLGYEKDNNW